MTQQRNADTPIQIRTRLKATKKQMDDAYIQMGRDLYLTFHRRLFIGWGYDTFKDYAEEELSEDVKRCERMKRIWAHFVKGCAIRPTTMQGLSYTNALALLPVTEPGNALGRIRVAKTLTWRDLRLKIAEWKSPAAAAVAGLPKAKPAGTAPAPPPPPTPPEGRTSLTYHVYPDQEKVIDAAIAEAQRGKASESAPNEALANVCTEFLGSRMSKERTPITRLQYMLSVLEGVYGGKIIWIASDEAADVLMAAMKKHPHLFAEPTTDTAEED
jgi:hypothetical protein